MKRYWGVILAVLILVAGSEVRAEQWEYPKTEEALDQAFEELSWELEPVQYSIGAAHAEYTLPEGMYILRDENARRFMFLNNGSYFPDVDAVVVDPESLHQLTFSFFEAGYVDDDDWSDLDADLLLKDIIESTEEANEERLANGVGPIEIVGWEVRPKYDRDARIAHWSISAKDESGTYANTIAIKLGRKGYSVLTFVGAPGLGSSSENLLTEALNNYEFDNGFRYADYTSGDALAGVGLASLVAVTAGSKGGKGAVVGVLAAVAIFAKKFWFLIFLPLAFFWKRVKNTLFGGRGT